jgi:hypothetical protein
MIFRVFLLIALLFSPFFAAAEDGSVVATGFGKSEDEAKLNAFAAAIEEAIGVFVASEILIENGKMVREFVQTDAQGFIESYSVISSGKEGDSYAVTIRAKVSQKKLQAVAEEISHINSANRSYEAVICEPGYKNALWCKGGSVAIGNMNFGIGADSYALLRYYESGEIVQVQLYARVLVREKPYFRAAKDQLGNELELRRVDSTESDYMIVVGGIDDLKKYVRSGLTIALIGDKKRAEIKIRAAYVAGFARYLEEIRANAEGGGRGTE